MNNLIRNKSNTSPNILTKNILWQNLPPWILYPILIPHVIKLCLKYKANISIISISNPIFPYGGLPFASKKEMFEPFKNHKEFLRYKLISNNIDLKRRIELSENFISKINYPVIAKPDKSHRGIDVHLLKNKEDLVNLLKTQKWDYLLQEYCDYDYEYGIFYCRQPDEKKGKIISLSLKMIPIIVGNGKDNLKDLIINSDIDNKKPLLERFSEQSELILKKDEIFKTMVCASHSRGAIFTDAVKDITQELIDKTDQISNINGFYFGRFDVRAKSPDELRNGNFKIIEINGATSEFIHIYDKNYSFNQGISDLKKQWNILFEISNKNRNKSINKLSLYKFLSKYISFFMLTKKVTGKLW